VGGGPAHRARAGWLESFRHKNLTAWIKRQAGINWAADIASKHRWKVVGKGFDAVVKPNPKAMTWVILHERAVARAGPDPRVPHPRGGVRQHRLNLLYFVLMIHDWAEQGQNAMMSWPPR